MTRIKYDGTVHYRNPADPRLTLCGVAHAATDLFGEADIRARATAERVTCPDCAKVVCAIRNEPYNTLVSDIADSVLHCGIYAAADPDGHVLSDDKSSAASAPSDATQIKLQTS